MQMRKMYQSTNKRIRATQARKDAQECERAGFGLLAQINWQTAMLLDPPRYDEDLVEG